MSSERAQHIEASEAVTIGVSAYRGYERRNQDRGGPKMSLEEEFTQALWGTMDAAKARRYIPARFIEMLHEFGGVETAKRLLVKSEPQTGLFELWGLNLLYESLEAIVIQERCQSLFTPTEIAEAKRRLEELEYFK